MKKIFSILLLLILTYSCRENHISAENKTNTNMDTATFGTGCFWCTEAIFKSLKGVISVDPGYSGGTVDNPTYDDVCNGTTGHAEVVQIVYDSTVISYDKLLEVFFHVHDPTSLNRQGADIGTQYRSVIFWHSEEQKKTIEQKIKELNESEFFCKHIVTEVTQLEKFYKAENYHLDYYAKHPEQSYCTIVVKPKVEKFKKKFTEMIK